MDWVNTLDLEKNFLGRLGLFLDQHLALRRISILFVFSLSLAFLLSFDFDFRYSENVGEIAATDIKSPLAFEIEDAVATEEKRVAAADGTPAVFDYNTKLYDKITDNVYQAFRFMREKRRTFSWAHDETRREELAKELFVFKTEFENILGSSVSDRYYSWLVDSAFNPRLEALVIRVLENWSDKMIAVNLDKFIGRDDDRVVVRVLQKDSSGAEAIVPIANIHDLTGQLDLNIDGVIGADKVNEADRRMVQRLAQSLVVPNVTLNSQETAARRKRARDAVLPVMLSIKKGQILVSEGALVQPIHITLFREIRRLKSDNRKDIVSLAMAHLFVTLILVFFSYLRRFSLGRVRVSPKDLAVMAIIMMGTVFLTKVFLFVTDAAFSGKYGNTIPPSAFLFLAPVAAGPMLVGLLISAGEIIWLFTFLMATALGLMVDLKFPFLIVTLVAGVVAARGLVKCRKRNDIYWSGLWTGVVQALTILFVMAIEYNGEGNLVGDLLWTVPAGFLSGIFSSFVAMMFIPLLETVFNYTTDIRLLELSNLDHPLLKEMVVKAPGTYHHSLIVGSMVESAAEEIGANPLLAKVMSYYHDIGKTAHAQYFIENQKPGSNPHDHLSPHMSKTVLVAHVKDGVELGMRYKLGRAIIDGIVQHHGTTLIAYFYNKAREMSHPDEGVQESEFRYPGPKPQFREAALVMLADSIEAAARSLDEPTPMRLANIVKNIIQRKFVEGQLEECDLTLRDLHVIEMTFYRALLSIYHHRIDYPRTAGGGAAEASVESGFVNLHSVGQDNS